MALSAALAIIAIWLLFGYNAQEIERYFLWLLAEGYDSVSLAVFCGIAFFILSSLGVPGLRFVQVLIATFLDYKAALLVGIIGGTAGTIPAYLLGKYMWRDYISTRFKHYVHFLERRYQRVGLYSIFALRMSAIVPNIIINIVSGASGLFSFRSYVGISALGLLPNIVLYNTIGYSIQIGNPLPDAYITNIQNALIVTSIAPLLIQAVVSALKKVNWRHKR